MEQEIKLEFISVDNQKVQLEQLIVNVIPFPEQFTYEQIQKAYDLSPDDYIGTFLDGYDGILKQNAKQIATFTNYMQEELIYGYLHKCNENTIEWLMRSLEEQTFTTDIIAILQGFRMFDAKNIQLVHQETTVKKMLVELSSQEKLLLLLQEMLNLETESENAETLELVERFSIIIPAVLHLLGYSNDQQKSMSYYAAEEILERAPSAQKNKILDLLATELTKEIETIKNSL